MTDTILRKDIQRGSFYRLTGSSVTYLAMQDYSSGDRAIFDNLRSRNPIDEDTECVLLFTVAELEEAIDRSTNDEM